MTKKTNGGEETAGTTGRANGWRGDSGQKYRREKITVPLSHPLILLRAQAPPPTVCNGAYDASRQNNDLDFNTFAFITPGAPLSLSPAIRAVSSFAIPHFAELRSLSYECSAPYRRRSFRSPSKCDTNGRGNPGLRSGTMRCATKGREEKGEITDFPRPPG